MPDQPTSVTVVVGAVAALAGAIAAGLANAYAAKQRVREIEVGYLQRLKDGYLENARAAIEPVYIPLTISLTDLYNSYDRLWPYIDFNKGCSNFIFRKDFVDQCLGFLQTMDDLMRRGADAYITSALDSELQQFTIFIRDSLDAEAVVRKRVFKTAIDLRSLWYLGFPSVNLRHSGSYVIDDEVQSKSRILSELSKTRIPPLSFRLLGLQMDYEERIYAAPIESRAFEEQMRIRVAVLKALIKEVTLGSRHSS